jgi:twinkle protein
MAAVIEADSIDWSVYEQQTEPQAKVRPASAWVDELIALDRAGPNDGGAVLPWAKTHELMRLRPGELTIWAGINGHGKSLLTGQVVLSLLAQKQRCMVASFEMKPAATLRRMRRQASCGAFPTEQFTRDFGKWTDGLLWLYDQQGMVDVPRVAAVLRYCSEELKIKHAVVDSLMKCVRGDDDYNGQKDMLDLLTSIGRDTGMHIHLVHHIRKADDENKLPGKFDLKGSSAISDQADNVMVVWRNKKKQFDSQAGKAVDEDAPDAMVICEKQRNGEWEGRIALWFHEASQQFVGVRRGPPQEYVR